MLLRCEVVDEFIFTCKPLSGDAAGTAVEVAEEAGWVLVGSGDVALQVAFAIARFGAILASMTKG